MAAQEGREASLVLSSLHRILSNAVRSGVPPHSVLALLDKERDRSTTKQKDRQTWLNYARWTVCARWWYVVPCLLISFLLHVLVLQLWNESTCIIPVPPMISGMIQPLANCNICQGVVEAPRFLDLNRKDFALHHAHSSRPIVVVGAALHWPAMEIFSYTYFMNLYRKFPDAIAGDTTQGQFFSYSSKIQTLKDLFELSPERVNMTSESWYIGWSTSDLCIAEELKSLISVPHFLSPMNNDNVLMWIFMGAPGPGASMHIDSVAEPSWQAQISGTKTWTLAPPLECESVCTSFNVTVHKGDIIVVDTNRWYHKTFVHAGNVSITIGAEYR